jgi:hypothetical protein
MILSPERIQEIKDIALANLKKADNSRGDFDKEKFWSLYRTDVRELLSAINSLEGKDE